MRPAAAPAPWHKSLRAEAKGHRAGRRTTLRPTPPRDRTPVMEPDPIDLAIFALNTLTEPEASSSEDMDVAARNADRAITHLEALRTLRSGPAVTTTLRDVLSFILTEATEDDLSRIHAESRQRTKTLRNLTAAAVTVGAAVTLKGIAPKYLNGLTGTVKSIRGQRAVVTLDAASTNRLRVTGQRFLVALDAITYDLRGVPLSVCAVD